MIHLDNLDREILHSLSKGAAHASLLEKITSVPRTTLSYRLRRLQTLHKVEPQLSGRKVLWKLSLNRQQNKSLFKIYKDAEFIECYKLLFTLKKDTFIYALQGKEAAKSEFLHIPEEFMLRAHTMLKRKRITMRALANESILEELSLLSEKLKWSHLGRQQSLKLVDKKFLSAGELFVTSSYISIINPKKRIGIVIKDRDVTVLFYDMMHLFFTLSGQIQSFDLNRHISGILDRDNTKKTEE